MAMDYSQRLAALRALEGVDAVALVPGANMVYFTGLHYHLSERPIVAFVMQDEIAFIMPELEVPQIRERSDMEGRLFVWNDADGFSGAFKEAVEALGLNEGTLGVDDKTMRVFELLEFLEHAPAMQVREFGTDLLSIRSRKSTDEVDAMRRAIEISEQALRKLLTWVQPDMTEREIAARLDADLMALGTQGYAFKALVQTGPNSALPHGGTTDRVLQAGEFLLIDFGGMYQGYPADITRTFCLGEASPEMQKIFNTVLAANQAAVLATRPGVACEDVDNAARNVIETAGYGEYFIHRTGHGLGLETHELPQIAAGVDDVLEPGMVFTIEPGIYIPGLGGVRIEDNVLVTNDGVEVLTSFPRELVRG
jgi:Xaa-Pro dipeptidase